MKQKHDIIVVGFRVDKAHNYVTGQAVMIDLFIDIMRRNGYKVYPVSLNYKLGASTTVGTTSLLRIVDYLRIFTAIIWTIIRHPNSVLYYSPVANKAGFIRDAVMSKIARLFACKVYMQQFGCRFEEFYTQQSPCMQRMIEATYRHATLITTEGEAVKSQVDRHVPKCHTAILPNGLALPGQKIPVDEDKWNGTETFHLLYLNNMIESKGWADVLEAVRILVNERRRDVSVTFAGKYMSVIDDEQFKTTEDAEAYFSRTVRDDHLEQNVSYFPSLFGIPKAQEWARTHAFLLPSYYCFEGQPTAVLEAFSQGAVPIVTRHSLIPDMVTEECGIFVAPKNGKEIADAVEQLMDNPDTYNQMSKAGRKRYNDYYTLECYEQRLLELFRINFER